MAKRISTDAKIVLEKAGYVVEYAYQRGKVFALHIWSKPFEFIATLPVVGACIDNDLIEALLEKVKK
jgi:hypothetical protein